MSDEYTRVPEYDLGRLRARRRKILDTTLDLVGLRIDGDVITQLARRVRAAFSKLQDDLVIRETLQPFIGQDYAMVTRDQVVLVLAGGYAQMRNGVPVRPFVGLPEPEWAPVEIDELRFGCISKGRSMASMVALVMAGTAVGQTVRKQMTMKFVTRGLARRLAWTLKDPRPVHSELVGMTFMAQLYQTERQQLDIKEYLCVPHQVRSNKELRKLRQEKCIRHYRQHCHTCPVGHTSCFRGTHRNTWVYKPCKSCKREEAPFDPANDRAQICLACSTKATRAHWARERRGMT